MDLLSLWEKMLANLKQVLPKEIFTNWFEGNIIPGNRRPGRHRPPDKGPADYEPGKEARSRKPARSRR